MAWETLQAFQGDWSSIAAPSDMGDPTRTYFGYFSSIEDLRLLRSALAIGETGDSYLEAHPGSEAVTLLASLAIEVPRPEAESRQHRWAFTKALGTVGRQVTRGRGGLVLAAARGHLSVIDGDLPSPAQTFPLTSLRHRRKVMQDERPVGAGYARVSRDTVAKSITLGWCSPADGDGRRSEVTIDVARIRARHRSIQLWPDPVRHTGGL